MPSKVTTPQVSFSQITAQIMSTVLEHKLRKAITHVLEPIHILRALNTGTCNIVTMSRVTYFHLFCRPTQEPVLATANTGKTQERFWKNAGEWTGRV